VERSDTSIYVVQKEGSQEAKPPHRKVGKGKSEKSLKAELKFNDYHSLFT
jgi:hypothetical protein